MAASIEDSTSYMLGRTNGEHERLIRQGRLIANSTRHFLEDMSLRPGMRVLDIGCGTGDVALLAATMVAPDGEVLGIDLDESALQLARHRAARQGLANAQFYGCDFRKYASYEHFDAVVGRCLLLHQHDPARCIASIAEHLRLGGLIGFQEPWFSQGFSQPKMPLFEEVIGWLHSMVAACGLDGDIGLHLASLFSPAGLPAPNLIFEMLVTCSAKSEIWDFIADTMRSLLPRLEQLGIVSACQVQLDSLAERLRHEQIALQSAVGVMPLMGAWCRKS